METMTAEHIKVFFFFNVFQEIDITSMLLSYGILEVLTF